MKPSARAVLSCWLVALGAAGCNRQSPPQSDAVRSPQTGIRYEANIAAGGVAPPAIELRIPQGGAANATAGGNLFASMNCDGCHGGGATGWVGPSLIDGRWRYGGADEEIFSSIYYGRPKGMPAFGGIVGAEGIWMLVAYLKSQPVPGIVPTTSYEDIAHEAPAAATAEAPPLAAQVPIAATTPKLMLAEYGCTACHAVDRKVVGPALVEVAAKYKGSDVEKALAEKVRSGGSGAWGSVPMTPNPQIPEQDLHQLIKWVLAL